MPVREDGVDRDGRLGRGVHPEDRLTVVYQRWRGGGREVGTHLSAHGVVVRSGAMGRIVLALNRRLVTELRAFERGDRDAEQ